MIPLHRLNGEEFFLNAHYIESVENSPDTRLTLANGKQLYVRESAEEVRRGMLIWQRAVRGPVPSKGLESGGP